MKKFFFIMILASLAAFPSFSQPFQSPNFLPGYISETGDTILLVTLREVTITAPLYFASALDYKRYRQWRSYGKDVVDYAVQAVRSYRELEAETNSWNSKTKKKRIKELQEQLAMQFKGPLKKLNKTQGKILVKMIERELNMPMYDVVKDLRGSFTATYWNQFSKVYGYNLKDGYRRGLDPVMDAVLSDYDLSYYMH